jgi:hypothetical protein
MMTDIINITVFGFIIIGVVALLYRGIRNFVRTITGKKNGCCG